MKRKKLLKSVAFTSSYFKYIEEMTFAVKNEEEH